MLPVLSGMGISISVRFPSDSSRWLHPMDLLNDWGSGFKVFVNCCNIQHDILPVWTLGSHHLIDVQSRFNANTFSCLKSQSEISSLVLAVQLLIGNMGREVCVENCTESQAIIPAAAEVCDVNILVALCFLLAPLQQGVPLGASIFSCQGRQGILPLFPYSASGCRGDRCCRRR